MAGKLRLICASLACIAAGSCDVLQNSTVMGTMGGALVGGGLCAATGTDGAGCAAYVIAGAIVGYGIGSYLDDRDLNARETALERGLALPQRAFERGDVSTVTSHATQNAISYIPLQSFRLPDGSPCRQFGVEYLKQGRPIQAVETYVKSPNGTWAPYSGDSTRSILDFPWPPPQPSSQQVIERSVFTQAVRLSDVSNKLETALRASKYEFSYYQAPGGFAIVARLERISDDGSPYPSETRFYPPNAAQPFDFGEYISQLFFAPEGYYRTVIFVVSDQPFRAVGQTISATDASALLADGANVLPASTQSQPFTAAHNATALIYEFRKSSIGPDVENVAPPGRLSAQTHLTKSGLADALGLRH